MEQQKAFLEGACAGDIALRREVERMLAAERGSDPILDAIAPIRTNAVPGVCPSCRLEIAASYRYCPFCGSPAQAGQADEGRFRPGALFAKRFRIVGVVGRGGMGEVYRASDLELGQAVALKFISAMRHDERARTRLRNEVRLARQISHPNVCRVYDLGEADGQLYLSMEYIDGEDLSALLRRIGRLPSDKALELALKLCSGLEAAHAQGVLHRDLKPGNVMIDARGELHVTDFGLAAAAGRVEGAEARNGTPAYMAPEQLSGQEASVRSDLYALGLVLYEMFTGRPPFQANTAAELLQLRQGNRITNPTAIVTDLDSAVERAILRCLDPDPKMRPESAWAVAALLPGGDPLAAVLAAGKTPSPKMVAAAGPIGALRLPVALSLLAGVAAGLALLCFVTPRVQMVAQLPLDRSPEVLAEKARDIVRSLGYSERPADSATGFENDVDFFSYLERRNAGSVQWNHLLGLPPSPVSFWYRQSPEPLTSHRVALGTQLRVTGVTLSDPSPAPGMVSVSLGLDGRLVRFAAVPRVGEPAPSPAGSARMPDWSTLFAAAHLDMGRFEPAAPQSALAAGADARAAWVGTVPERSDLAVRVEAAASNGRPILFETIWPWAQSYHPRPDSSAKPTQGLRAFLLLSAAALLARYNWKTGAGDRQGAWRIGLFFSSALLSCFILRVPLQQVWSGALPLIVFQGLVASVLYLALEPWVRRRWPQTLITWSRILEGRWRDPLVGRDVLAGLLAAMAVGLLTALFAWIQMRLGAAPPGAIPTITEMYFYLDNLLGTRVVLADIANRSLMATGIGLSFLLVLFLLRALLRKEWLAAGAIVVLEAGFELSAGSSHPVITTLLWVAIIVPQVVILLRLGLFAFVCTLFGQSFATSALLTTDFTAWYGQSSLIGVIVMGVLSLWAFRVSLGTTGRVLGGVPTSSWRFHST